MTKQHLAELYNAMRTLNPVTAQSHHLLRDYMARTGHTIILGAPDNPDCSTVAWAIFGVPYFSQAVLNESDLNQYVMLTERAQAALAMSKGISRFSTIITDNVIGL